MEILDDQNVLSITILPPKTNTWNVIENVRDSFVALLVTEEL